MWGDSIGRNDGMGERNGGTHGIFLNMEYTEYFKARKILNNLKRGIYGLV